MFTHFGTDLEELETDQGVDFCYGLSGARVGLGRYTSMSGDPSSNPARDKQIVFMNLWNAPVLNQPLMGSYSHYALSFWVLLPSIIL